jgi:hypothetical protein
MTAIERTAYPQFKTQPSTKELAELYSPTAQEVAFAQAQTKSKRGLLRLLMMLKSFQRLGYFPRSEAVPVAVVNHIRTCLNLSAKVSAIAPERSRYVYQNIIRSYLGVHSYDQKAQKAMATAVAHAAEVMDHPADLINVAIEELVKERYELPAFSTLDRLVRRIRTATHTRLFHRLSEAMTAKEQQFVDQLLAPSAPDPTQPAEFEVTLALLKAPPKSARLSHIEALQAKFNRIMSFGDANRLVATIAPAKVKAFAAQAKALTLCDLQDAKVPKRRALLVCLLYQAQVKTRDHLVEMFLKRMHKIHKSARERLSALREKHLAQTESILDLFTEVLQVSITEADDATVGSGVRSLLQLHGGGSTLLGY